MRPMLVRAGVLAGVLAAAVAAAASASPYVRNCGTRRDGSLTQDLHWETSGPWHVAMSYQTAASIARRVGPGEFQPPSSHPAPREVPCVVATAVAFRAADAWTRWSGNDGVVGVAWIGYATGPYLGRFTCTGISRPDGGARERCVHRRDRHAGAITVGLTITPAPGA